MNHSSLPINNSNQSTDSQILTRQIPPDHSTTCYICLENILTMNKQFGLQNNCDHFFCFDCLLTWRRTVRF